MSEEVETIKVVADNEQGYKVINKADKSESDKIYSEQASKPVHRKSRK